MKYENGKLVEASREELFKMYKGPYRQVYRSFTEFELAIMMSGCEIIENAKTLIRVNKSNK